MPGAYKKSRARLKAMVQAELQVRALVDGQVITPARRRGLAEEADEVLASFEKLSANESYGRGVKQSFWGSWLYTLSVLALSGFAYAASLNVRTVVTNLWNTVHPSQGQVVAPAVTPFPTATPSPDPAVIPVLTPSPSATP